MPTTSTLVRSTIFALAVSALALGQQGAQTKLFPSSGKPTHGSATLDSTEQRVGNVVYQIFYMRNAPKREVFRVDIGFYDKKQLVKDWNYGLIQEKDTNGDGTPDYVWYGGDDTGQRLLWFLSKDHEYKCVNVFKTAEAAWQKRFSRPPPDLGAVFEEEQIGEVTWDKSAQLLNVKVVNNGGNTGKAPTVKLTVSPADFVFGER